MKYVPKKTIGNVNVSSQAPLKDFGVMVLKILVVLFGVYIILGLAVDFIIPRVSLNMEQKIGNLFSRNLKNKHQNKQQAESEAKLQKILDRLVVNASLPALNYKVYAFEASRANALAWPGGKIIVFHPLLKKVKSENEIAMVLAHELGHFVRRDHLRGMGRGLVFIVLSTITLGADSQVSRFIGNTLANAEMRFSQAQEQAADLFAVDLLNKTYNNSAGATDFLGKMAQKEKLGRFFFFFSSHPYTLDRVRVIENRMREKGYLSGEKIPLKFP